MPFQFERLQWYKLEAVRVNDWDETSEGIVVKEGIFELGHAVGHNINPVHISLDQNNKEYIEVRYQNINSRFNKTTKININKIEKENEDTGEMETEEQVVETTEQIYQF